MPILQNGHEIAQGISCNDRKFETWRLKSFRSKDGRLYSCEVSVQVYAVPKDGARGNETDGFKIVINGIPVTSRDLVDLRAKAEALLRNLSEDEHEKVLIVKTSGMPGRNQLRYGQREEFGLSWELGWRVAKAGRVFDFTRSYCIDVENYDEDEQNEMIGDIIIGSKPGHRGKQDHKTAVIPWTQEREDVLRKTVASIAAMRESLNDELLKAESFALLLDTKAGMLLQPPRESP